MKAAQIRMLHEYFAENWLQDWIDYYSEARSNAEANCKYMRNIRVKTKLIILELEVSEHSALAFTSICDFLRSRAALMREDLGKKPSTKSRDSEYRFLLKQLTQFSFAAAQFAMQKKHEYQRSMATGLEAQKQLSEMPELALLFQHQVAVSSACCDSYQGFIDNICNLIDSVLNLLK